MQTSKYWHEILHLPLLNLNIGNTQTFTLLQQMLYSLLCSHWARLCRYASLVGWDGSDGAVGYLDAKGGLPKFQMLKTLACRFAYPGDFLLYWRYKLDNVGFTGGKGEHSTACTPNENGGMRLLHRFGNEIGRASCRERGEVCVVSGSVVRKM